MALIISYVASSEEEILFLCSKWQLQACEDLRIYSIPPAALYMPGAHIPLQVFWNIHYHLKISSFYSSLFISCSGSHSRNFCSSSPSSQGWTHNSQILLVSRFKLLNFLKVKQLKTKTSRPISIRMMNILLVTITFTFMYHSINNTVFLYSIVFVQYTIFSCICNWMRYTPRHFIIVCTDTL